MKDHKTAAAIYSIAAVICYLAAIIGIIRESSFGIVFLCFGSMFLCFSSARKGKEKNVGSEESGQTDPNEEPQDKQ